ncbi:MAG: N-acetylneuraminate synthase family protein [Candidatus Bathyarchaeota archaeon]|nr:N-acetylneuraminate synthase family protein [Candidatus Bathyarchaeota archaeon]
MTYIIAEIGINHNGSLDTAKRLIDVAAVAGCDAVKFQKRNPDVCVPDHQKGVMRNTPWGEMTYLDYKKKVEFEKEEYDIINQYCKDRSIAWSASPWDLGSLEFLMKYDIPFIKIPSAMLTNVELLKSCTGRNKWIIISTGMSTQEEIDAAHEILKGEKLSILHCNSSYPAPNNELNLNCIKSLKERYNTQVGYSGHEFGLTTTMASIYLGAEVLERHITLDRTMWGTDQMCSVEPQGLIKLVRGVRELEQALGSHKIQVTETEKEVRRKLRG